MISFLGLTLFALCPTAATADQDHPGWALAREAERARKEGRDAEALELFRSALKAKPDDIEAHIGYQKLRLSRKEERDLISEYEDLLRSRGASWCCFLYGRLLHDPVREVALYERGLSGKPGDPWLLRALAGALWRMGRRDEALLKHAEAIAARPDDLEWRFEHLQRMKDAGRIAETFQACRESCENSPGDFKAHLLLGLALTLAGRKEEARPSIDRACSLAPGNGGPLKVRGLHLFRERSFEPAIAAFEEALRVDPHDPSTLQALGMMLFTLRKDPKGIAMVGEAARLEPDSSPVQSDLGAIALLKGDFDAAEERLRDAIRIDPSNDDALRA